MPRLFWLRFTREKRNLLCPKIIKEVIFNIHCILVLYILTGLSDFILIYIHICVCVCTYGCQLVKWIWPSLTSLMHGFRSCANDNGSWSQQMTYNAYYKDGKLSYVHGLACFVNSVHVVCGFHVMGETGVLSTGFLTHPTC